MNKAKLTCALLTLIGATGCGADGGGAFDDAELGDVQQDIRGGTIVTKGAYGVVDYFLRGSAPVTDDWQDCTGTLIAPNAVLTAAHCLVALNSQNALGGPMSLTVRYFDPEAGTRIIYDSDVHGAARWTKFPTYHGDINNPSFPAFANDDVAVLLVPRFDGTDYHDYKRIYADSDAHLLEDNLRIYGAGFFTHSGRSDANMRSGSFSVDVANSNHVLVDNEDNLNICHGDSGGGAMKTASTPGNPDGLELLVGDSSLMEDVDEGSVCGNSSHRTAYCRIGSQEIDWLQGVLPHACPVKTGATLKYRRCFDLPFIEDVDFEEWPRGVTTAIASVLL